MRSSSETIIYFLHDELLEVIATHLELEELCNLWRTSTRFRDFVRQAENVWKGLTAQHFGHGALSAPSWREEFQSRYVEDSRKRRLQRAARVMRAKSKLQVTERDVHRIKGDLDKERSKLQALVSEQQQLKQRLEQARRLNASMECWQPDVVKNHHERLLAQTPVAGEWRSRELDMGIADHELALQTLTKSLQVKTAQLQKQRISLQALLGT